MTYCLHLLFAQHNSISSWICSVIGYKRHQNVVRTSLTHSPDGSFATILFLQYFDVICDQLLLNKRTATWDLFGYWTYKLNYTRTVAQGRGSGL